MNTVVLKWGGSVLQHARDLSALKNTVADYEGRRVVVVSALQGVTDSLERLLNSVPIGAEEIAKAGKRLYDNHALLLTQTKCDTEEALHTLRARIEVFEQYLTLCDTLGYVPADARDAVLSFGERLASCVLTAVLAEKDQIVKEALPEDVGLVTDGRFGDAEVNLDVAREYVSRSLSEGVVYVVPGFYGVSQEGRVTLFGRGGSDYTAAVLACCLHAETADFFKDVPGFMSADPKFVHDAVPISRLNYDEAAELTCFGAKILHPGAVSLLKHFSIAARIYNVRHYRGADNPESVIGKETQQTEGALKSVAFTDNCAVIQFAGTSVGIKPGILADITTVFSRSGINIKTVLTSLTAINVLVASTDVPLCRELFAHARIVSVDDIAIDDDVSLIAAVGSGINEHHGILARILKALSEKEINVRMFSAGASSCAVYVIVRRADRNEAVNAAHSALLVRKKEGVDEKVKNYR